MQKITVISVGQLKEDFFKKAEAEYLKRLGAYCRVEVVEVAQSRLPTDPSKGQIAASLKEEARLIEARIPKNAEIIPLCIEGRELSSEGLAKVIESNADMGSGELAFIIGGSYGLCDTIKQMGRLRLSMSPMTFPHRLARIMLLEQLYRGYRILSGGKYHK